MSVGVQFLLLGRFAVIDAACVREVHEGAADHGSFAWLSVRPTWLDP